MFKKSLIAVAALSALAGSAMAADVQIYGRIDTGLRYSQVDYDVPTVDDKTTFEMATGNSTGNRVGIKGSEDLGNGLTVGFVLENGFDADTGAEKYDGLFGREALVYLEGGFGKVGFGKMGILNSTAGSFAIGNFTPWGTGWGAVGDQTQIFGAKFETRYSNMISYRSPEFAGFQVHAQYSFGSDEKDDAGKVVGREGKTTTDRYYAIGATYTVGGLNLIGIVDSINEKHQTGDDPDDTLRVTLGGSYDFGVVKPYLSAAYFKDARLTSWMDCYDTGDKNPATNKQLKGDWDGYGIVIGASAPLVGGTAHMTIGYMDAEAQKDYVETFDPKGADLTRYTFAIGYEYPLSKRTKVYADAGYFKDEVDYNSENWNKREPEGYQAAVGLVHQF